MPLPSRTAPARKYASPEAPVFFNPLPERTIVTMKALDFGVQSYCFRNFKDNADVAKKVREIGVDKIELCGVHADFNKPSAVKDVVKTYTDAGVSIISLGVQTFTGAASERDWFECAALAGAKHISAHFCVD